MSLPIYFEHPLDSSLKIQYQQVTILPSTLNVQKIEIRCRPLCLREQTIRLEPGEETSWKDITAIAMKNPGMDSAELLTPATCTHVSK